MKQPNKTNRRNRAGSQRGLSLIELMISITIGLLILVSLTSMFVNQSKARAELDKSNRMIDNGRYALELLSDNVRLAGFFGAYGPSGTPSAATLPDPCDTSAAAFNLDFLLLHVQGYNAETATSQITSPPCSLTNTAGTALSLKAGSDILVVRRANTSTVAQATAPNNGTVYLQVRSCQYGPSDYLMSTDPAVLTLGQRNITGVNNCYSAGGVTHIDPPYASLRQLKVEVYFVSPNNNPGDGIPTLKRRELTATGFQTMPLVEGIEYMQIDYGVDDPAMDSDGDGIIGLDGVADSYTSCAACTLEQWSNVVSVRLNLVARNIDATRDYTDNKAYSLGSAGSFTPSGTDANYKRHAYTQNIRLTNPSGRRESP